MTAWRGWSNRKGGSGVSVLLSFVSVYSCSGADWWEKNRKRHRRLTRAPDFCLFRFSLLFPRWAKSHRTWRHAARYITGGPDPRLPWKHKKWRMQINFAIAGADLPVTTLRSPEWSSRARQKEERKKIQLQDKSWLDLVRSKSQDITRGFTNCRPRSCLPLVLVVAVELIVRTHLSSPLSGSWIRKWRRWTCSSRHLACSIVGLSPVCLQLLILRNTELLLHLPCSKVSGVRFLVKWAGYRTDESTWEPAENISDELIRWGFCTCISVTSTKTFHIYFIWTSLQRVRTASGPRRADARRRSSCLRRRRSRRSQGHCPTGASRRLDDERCVLRVVS